MSKLNTSVERFAKAWAQENRSFVSGSKISCTSFGANKRMRNKEHEIAFQSPQLPRPEKR